MSAIADIVPNVDTTASYCSVSYTVKECKLLKVIQMPSSTEEHEPVDSCAVTSIAGSSGVISTHASKSGENSVTKSVCSEDSCRVPEQRGKSIQEMEEIISTLKKKVAEQQETIKKQQNDTDRINELSRAFQDSVAPCELTIERGEDILWPS
jgi:3-oxoacyl-ACP reductase-like protein